ncbi:MAG: GrpB family protein [Thermonemataceae bacterium]
MSDNKNFFGSIDNVVLKAYNPHYVTAFALEVDLLRSTLPNLQVKYHHIGSTAIPAIISKPIIDIAIELTNFPLNEEEIEALSTAGYTYWANNPESDHQFFFKNLPRTHHLHFYPTNSVKLSNQIAFRDKLNQDATLRDAYEKLKIELAAKYTSDRERYTFEKSTFINKVLNQKRPA